MQHYWGPPLSFEKSLTLLESRESQELLRFGHGKRVWAHQKRLCSPRRVSQLLFETVGERWAMWRNSVWTKIPVKCTIYNWKWSKRKNGIYQWYIISVPQYSNIKPVISPANHQYRPFQTLTDHLRKRNRNTLKEKRDHCVSPVRQIAWKCGRRSRVWPGWAR